MKAYSVDLRERVADAVLQEHGIVVSGPTLSRVLRYVFGWSHNKNQLKR
jgi:hypothetical protein